MYTVVFHHQYYSATDNGCRVYESDSRYLEDYPSMYTWVADFETEEEAEAFCEAQPVDEEANLYFNFEIYTSDPVSGTTGWDIKMVSVRASNREEARESLKEFPYFDCVILFNFQHSEKESHDFLLTECWPEFKIVGRI